MTKYFLAVWVVVLVGCTSLNAMKHQDQFNKTSHSYEKALRWGDWVAASSLLDLKGQALDYRAIDKLKQIKVTSYEVNELVMSEDALQVNQSVEIQYYHTHEMVEKTLVDRQVWEYRQDEGWRLVSGLPKF